MPIQLCLSLFAIGLTIWRQRFAGLWDRTAAPVLTLLAASIPVLVLITWSSTVRYVGDFFPLIVIGTIHGGVHLSARAANKGRLQLALTCVSAIAIYLSLVQFSLDVESWQLVG
jgi:hypothetical protein